MARDATRCQAFAELRYAPLSHAFAELSGATRRDAFARSCAARLSYAFALHFRTLHFRTLVRFAFAWLITAKHCHAFAAYNYAPPRHAVPLLCLRATQGFTPPSYALATALFYL